MRKQVISPLNVTIDDLLVNLLDFEPIINELELLDDVERKRFSFKDLEGPLQRPGFSSLRDFLAFFMDYSNIGSLWHRGLAMASTVCGVPQTPPQYSQTD